MAIINLLRSVIPGAMGFAILSDQPDRNPGTQDGRDYDFWLNGLTGVLFRKESGVWVSLFTLRPKQGKKGDTGARGLSILSGIGAPNSSVGRSGEFYIELDNAALPISIRGPRTPIGWPSTAVPFAKMLFGSGVPSNSLGYDGQDYLDHTNLKLHGPKAGGVWPAGVSLVGPLPWAQTVPWAASTTYVAAPPASTVFQGGSTYVCIVPHVSAVTFDPSKWQIIAAKGADGLGTGNVNPTGAPVVVGHGVVFGATDGNTIQSSGFPMTRGYIVGLSYGDLTLGF